MSKLISKVYVLNVIDRQEMAFRLTLLASQWFTSPFAFSPSAIEIAQNTEMEFGGKLISFLDLAEGLQKDPYGTIAPLTDAQLYEAVRASLEATRQYCLFYDKETGLERLYKKLQKEQWFVWAKAIRDAASHDQHFRFDAKNFKDLMPRTWNGITIKENLHGKPLTQDMFWANAVYQLLIDIKKFVQCLPDFPN